MRTSSLRAGLALLLWTLLLAPGASPALAQKPPKPYALIFGTVFGPHGRGLAGVPIVIRRADNKKGKWNLISDRRGEFAQRLPAGAAEYIVAVDAKRKKGETKALPQVRVVIENDERRDISLHLTE